MFLYNQFLKCGAVIKMKVASSSQSSLSISFQVYYGQTPLHLKNDWELVFRESQLQALEEVELVLSPSLRFSHVIRKEFLEVPCFFCLGGDVQSVFLEGFCSEFNESCKFCLGTTAST